MTAANRLLPPLLMLATLLLPLPVYAQSLPAEMEADRLVLAAEEKMARQDYEGARQYLARVAPLKVEPGANYFYLFALVKQHDGDLEDASAQFAQYVKKAGRDGDHYEEALRQLTLIEEQLRSREAVTAARTGTQAGLKSAGIQIADSEGTAYDARIRQQFPAGTLAASLVLHINSLLHAYPYLEGRIKNPDTSPQEHYSLAVKDRGEVLVTRTARGSGVPQGQAAFSVSRVNAFGVSPFVSYRCSPASDSCLIRNPVDGSDWIRIANEEDTARELSTALTRLLKALQR